MKAVPLLCCLLLVQYITGCTHLDRVNLAKDEIIDKETMVHLMADMDITEAALKLRLDRMSRDSMNLLSQKAYDSLYLYYKTTPRIFKENLKYYQEDIELYKEMTDEKVTIITQKRDSIAIKPEVLDTTKIKQEILKEKKISSEIEKSQKEAVKKVNQSQQVTKKPVIVKKEITVKNK